MSTKRLNVNLPEETYEGIKRLSEENNQSITTLVKLALGLVKIAYTAKSEGSDLAVVRKKDGEYEVKKEIVIP